MAAKEGDIGTIERLVHTKYIDVNAANDGVYDDDDDDDDDIFFVKVSTYVHQDTWQYVMWQSSGAQDTVLFQSFIAQKLLS